MITTLAPGEDATLLAELLERAPAWLESGRAQLRVHADTEPDSHESARQAQRETKLRAIRAGRAKRYVLEVETRAGPRVVKIAEVTSLGNHVLGLLGTSIARREHAFHARAHALGFAASRSLGFLEWRVGPFLQRACQVQTLIPNEARDLDHLLVSELARWGDAALEPLADALAAMHTKGFFHADLKGFHAFVVARNTLPDGPQQYDLTWIDLARVGFRLTRRQRLINLYQALRFVVPPRPQAQERFMTRYCAAAVWHAATPQLALARVQRLLRYKLRTHPHP
ncbi:MAG: lipopolysaccharide kinase InaA family protein [Myxococcota bacterium]